MKKIGLSLIMFTCLMINIQLQAKENTLKNIQNINQINFILKLQFANNSYILDSKEILLNEKLEKLKKEDFSNLQSRFLRKLSHFY